MSFFNKKRMSISPSFFILIFLLLCLFCKSLCIHSNHQLLVGRDYDNLNL